MTTIYVTVPVTYRPPNDYTLMHHAVVHVSSVGSSSAPQNRFAAGDVLAKLKAVGFADNDIVRGGNELIAYGRTTFASDSISQADLRSGGLV